MVNGERTVLSSVSERMSVCRSTFMKRTHLIVVLSLLVANQNTADGGLVFSDDFNTSTLNPAWTVSFHNATGWTYTTPSISGTDLRVTDILGVPLQGDNATPDDWGMVMLTRQFQAVGDFRLQFNISWDSEGRLDPMQALYVSLLDTNHQYVANAGYDDTWSGYTGTKIAGIGGVGFVQSGKGSLPLSAVALIVFERVGSAFAITWNGQPIISGANSTPIAEVQMNFQFFNYDGSSAPRSTFANESVDLITLSTPDGAVPEPASLTLWSLGAVGMAAFNRRRGRAKKLSGQPTLTLP